MFGCYKILRKKNVKKNYFSMLIFNKIKYN